MKYVLDTHKLYTLLHHHGILIEVDEAGVAVEVKVRDRGSLDYEKSEYTAEFERFWKAYPRRDVKKEAYRAWQQVYHVMPNAEVVIKQAAAFAEHCKREGTEKRFIPHPSTWLRAFRWEDVYQARSGLPPMTDGKIRIYRDMQKESETHGTHPRWSEYRNKVMSGQIKTGFKEFVGEDN